MPARTLFIGLSGRTRILAGQTVNCVLLRGVKYNKKGGLKPGRRLPINWRKIDHNPAKIPWGWIPDKWKEETTIDYEYEKEVAKFLPDYQHKIRDVEHPNYHDEPLYQFCNETRPIEGLQQVLCLTKSIVFEDLPASIRKLEEASLMPNQDERVIQIVRHAHLFDIDPKNLDKENKVSWYRQNDFYICPRLERYSLQILENLLRLCQSHPTTSLQALQRLQVQNIESKSVVRRICDINYESENDSKRNWLVAFESTAETQILAKEPLKPFALADEVQNTASVELQDIFPVYPIIDLTKAQIYEDKANTGLENGFSHSHLHTLFLINLKNFSPEELYAQMTAQLFACLSSRAIEMYGEVPMDLPEPICGQVIAMDGQNYQFMCMQLNTMKMNCDSGVKNMVWIRSSEEGSKNREPISMYESCSHRVWQDPNYFLGYDPSVFQTFLAFWLNGAVVIDM